MQVASLSNLNILHVIPSISAADGGPTRALLLMERALRDLGVRVTTLTTDHDLSAPATRGLAAGGGERYYAHKWMSRYKVAPGIVPYLARHITAFDVVHIHALFSFTSTVAAWAAQLSGTPYVVRPLGTLSSYGLSQRRPRLKRLSVAAIEAPILRRAAAVHFTSRTEEAEVRNLGIPLRSVVIPLGVEVAVAAPCAAIDLQEPRLAGRRHILYLSRLDPKKNVEGLIEAVAGSESLQKGAMLVIAGDGDPGYVRFLKSKANSAGIGRLVVWLGHVEGERKAAALAAADVFVLPSFSENFGIAAVEAMLAGVPCVLAPGVAIADEVATAHAGFVGGPDPGDLATAITQILANDALRMSMSQRAKAFAVSTYSSAAMGRRLIDLYSGVSQSEYRKRR